MKVRLTKKRLQVLENAISIDDVLYEKFRRLNEDLTKREQRFAARKMIREVVQVKDKLHIKLPILKVQDAGEGLIVVVG